MRLARMFLRKRSVLGGERRKTNNRTRLSLERSLGCGVKGSLLANILGGGSG